MTDKEKFLIQRLKSKHIGDDAAVVGDLIYSADAFCEDTHFRREWMSPYQIGRKAMMVNFSDAVAMNATPKYALVTLSLPRDFEEQDIVSLLDGIEDAASEWGCEIIGGDTVGSDKLNLSITVISQSDDPLFRTGLKPGDMLAFTGELGSSRKDLQMLESGKTISNDSKFYTPRLRGEFIRSARPYLRAGMDISDGLFCDTNTLLDTNKYGIKILKNIDEDIGLSGEEYEMLIAFGLESASDVEAIARQMQIPLTIFARVAQNMDRLPCFSHHFG